MTEERGWESTLKGLVDRMVETCVTELDVRRGDLHVRLRRRSGDAIAPECVESDQTSPGTSHLESHAVVAPLTGVFYASPNPSASPYVEAGDWVEEGAVVGLIETMKVFNEVNADRRGRIISVEAKQGQLVQSGETLVLIDLEAAPDQAVEVES